MTLDEEILTGLTEQHIVAYGESKVHVAVLPALQELEKALEENGFRLGIASSFRGFQAQVKIWNAKARGEKTLLDANSKPLAFAKLSKKEIMHSILRWSALPGLSRHHWGTDFDIYDKNTLPKDYRLELIPSEFEGSGYFAKMHTWLDKNMRRYGFYRPYDLDRGGVSPERWHVSYAPLSEKLMNAHSIDLVVSVLEKHEIELKELAIAEIQALFQRYFLAVSVFR